MRITASRGDHTVTIEIDGASPKLLKQAEATAERLLGEAPKPTAKTPFGFASDSSKPAG